MLAVDTNVVVRFLVADDVKQASAAKTLFVSGEKIWIAKTVLLETVWVLRSRYGFLPGELNTALSSLLGLESVTVEDTACIASALALTNLGVSFADALHLSSRPAGATFVSFDKAFVRRAARAGVDRLSAI